MVNGWNMNFWKSELSLHLWRVEIVSLSVTHCVHVNAVCRYWDGENRREEMPSKDAEAELWRDHLMGCDTCFPQCCQWTIFCLYHLNQMCICWSLDAEMLFIYRDIRNQWMYMGKYVINARHITWYLHLSLFFQVDFIFYRSTIFLYHCSLDALMPRIAQKHGRPTCWFCNILCELLHSKNGERRLYSVESSNFAISTAFIWYLHSLSMLRAYLIKLVFDIFEADQILSQITDTGNLLKSNASKHLTSNSDIF